MGNYVIGTRTTAAPAQVVWDIFVDVDSWPETFASHLEAAHLEGEVEPGATGWVQLKRPPLNSSFVVNRVVPGRNWSWTGKILWMELGFDHVVEPTDHGSRITFDVDLDGPLAAVMRPLMRLPYLSQMNRALDNLVETAEKTSIE